MKARKRDNIVLYFAAILFLFVMAVHAARADNLVWRENNAPPIDVAVLPNADSAISAPPTPTAALNEWQTTSGKEQPGPIEPEKKPEPFAFADFTWLNGN